MGGARATAGWQGPRDGRCQGGGGGRAQVRRVGARCWRRYRPQPRVQAAGEASFVGAMVIVDLVKTTLGPKGMDKILQSTGRGRSVTVTNDGATTAAPLVHFGYWMLMLLVVGDASNAAAGGASRSRPRGFSPATAPLISRGLAWWCESVAT